MSSIDFFDIAVSLGVPGFALAIFYMLFRKFKWKFPAVPKAYVGPIIILFILAVSVITLTAIVYSKSPETSSSATKVKDRADTLYVSKSESLIEFIKIENAPSKSLVDEYSDLEPKITVNTSGFVKDPFPKMRITMVNRDSEHYVITGLKLQIENFQRKKGNTSEVVVLDKLVTWHLVLPEEEGIYIMDTIHPISFPAQSYLVLDVAFLVQHAKQFFAPMSSGSFTFTFSFLTDTKQEVPLRSTILI